jgi:3-hydroxyisobutyrate dehydrogenase-like beta-hydroxyacid dehydrogenase
MAMPTVAIVSPGEMGAGIACALTRVAGCRVFTVLEGRSRETVERARESGMIACADLGEMVASCELVLSVVPPAIAAQTAAEIAQAMFSVDGKPDFVDCNAVSPDTLAEIANSFAGLDARFVDAGIIGAPPEQKRPRLYVSGPRSAPLMALDGIAFDIVPLGPDAGRASAMKIVYASITKGTNALLAAALVTAERNGLLEPLLDELQSSQAQLFRRADANVGRLPADAARWAPEMMEIARTFDAAGMPGDIHRGTAAMMEHLARSEFGSETRRTQDRARTMSQTVKAIARGLK